MKLANVLILAFVVVIPSLAMARNEAAPDMELLEFLGGFETVGGKPVDPLSFADANEKNPKKVLPYGAKKEKKQIRKSEKQEQKEHDDEK